VSHGPSGGRAVSATKRRPHNAPPDRKHKIKGGIPRITIVRNSKKIRRHVEMKRDIQYRFDDLPEL
jgi:hypothetical protein